MDGQSGMRGGIARALVGAKGKAEAHEEPAVVLARAARLRRVHEVGAEAEGLAARVPVPRRFPAP